jgi:hypothetical protein
MSKVVKYNERLLSASSFCHRFVEAALRQEAYEGTSSTASRLSELWILETSLLIEAVLSDDLAFFIRMHFDYLITRLIDLDKFASMVKSNAGLLVQLVTGLIIKLVAATDDLR